MSPLVKRRIAAKMRVAHHRVSLDEVMHLYANALEPNIWKYEYFCDTAKGQVVFDLYIEGEDKE